MIEIESRHENAEDYRGKQQTVLYRIRLNGQLRDVSKADLIRALDMNLPQTQEEPGLLHAPRGNGHASVAP